MKILAIDLGKSVACNYLTATGTARFVTVVTHANEFDRLLSQESPDLVVIETCSIAGWGCGRYWAKARIRRGEVDERRVRVMGILNPAY